MKKLLFISFVLFSANSEATTDNFLEYHIPVMSQAEVRYIKVSGLTYHSVPEGQIFGINDPYYPPTPHEQFKNYDVNLTSQQKLKVTGQIYPLEACTLKISGVGTSAHGGEVAQYTKTALQMTLKDIAGIHDSEKQQEQLKNCRIDIE